MCPHSNYMCLQKCGGVVVIVGGGSGDGGGGGDFKGRLLLLNEYIFPKTNYAA